MAFQFNGISSKVTISGQVTTDAGAFYSINGTDTILNLISTSFIGNNTEQTIFEETILSLSPQEINQFKLSLDYQLGSGTTLTCKIYVNNELVKTTLKASPSGTVIEEIEAELKANDVLKITGQRTNGSSTANLLHLRILGENLTQKPAIAFKG